MVNPVPEIQTLPKTTEGAVDRYFHTLETYQKDEISSLFFQGMMFSLKNDVRERIYRLHKEVPQFYDDKLPTLMNQATSELLREVKTNKKVAFEFHRTHHRLLAVLDRLVKYQPPGELDFRIETIRDVRLTEIEQEFVLFRYNAESILNKKIQELYARSKPKSGDLMEKN